jgi:hypothetical protein
MDTTCWVHLRKPHWLGPWVQSATPDPHDVLATLEQIELMETPRLFASMQWDASVELWKEQERLFIVPAKWPY